MRHPVIPDSTCSWFLDSTLISIEFTTMAVMNPPERKLAKPLCSYETYKKLYKHIKLETLQTKLLLIHTIVIVFLFFQVTSLACLSTVLTASRPNQKLGLFVLPHFLNLRIIRVPNVDPGVPNPWGPHKIFIRHMYPVLVQKHNFPKFPRGQMRKIMFIFSVKLTHFQSLRIIRAPRNKNMVSKKLPLPINYSSGSPRDKIKLTLH